MTEHPRGIGRRAVMIAGALMLLVDASDAQAESSSLSGRYRFTGGKRERKAIEDAIEDVVSEMSAIARPIARRRLREACRVAGKIRIDVGDDGIAVTYDALVFKGPADGTPITVEGSDGDELELRCQVTESGVKQSFDKEQGGKVNAFRPRGERRMTMQVRIHSERLPKDLKYKLTYSRK